MTTYNLGSLGTTPQTRTDTVSSGVNNTDIFQFTLGSTRNINIALTGITGTEQAALSLFRDTNNNGVLDSTDQRIVGTFDSGGDIEDDALINYRSQAAGTYFAKVTYGAGSLVDYKISLSATGAGSPSNLLPTEINVGNLNSQAYATFTDYISNQDTVDTYKFNLNTDDVAFTASLTGLSADADIRLIRDFNGNGVVDAGERIASSALSGTSPEQINTTLDAGDYFIQVFQYSGSTSYNLSLIALS
ncbi:MAG TPA: pre-peptidase C-terminal domain-containing protein [Leptolyngbyaceae cyanobacterium]